MATGNGSQTAGRTLSARELAQAALTTAGEMTGFEPEAATRLEWDGEAWCVEVDVLELARIPSTTDVLGRFEIRLLPDGTLRGYRRVARFHRADAYEEE